MSADLDWLCVSLLVFFYGVGVGRQLFDEMLSFEPHIPEVHATINQIVKINISGSQRPEFIFR